MTEYQMDVLPRARGRSVISLRIKGRVHGSCELQRHSDISLDFSPFAYEFLAD